TAPVAGVGAAAPEPPLRSAAQGPRPLPAPVRARPARRSPVPVAGLRPLASTGLLITSVCATSVTGRAAGGGRSAVEGASVSGPDPQASAAPGRPPRPRRPRPRPCGVSGSRPGRPPPAPPGGPGAPAPASGAAAPRY